jgi:hypothetical protein
MKFRLKHSILAQALVAGTFLGSLCSQNNNHFSVGVNAFGVVPVTFSPHNNKEYVSSLAASASTEDCGCSDVTFSGKPTEQAKQIDAREALRGSQKVVLSVDGEKVSFDSLIGEPSENKVSVVVFLRSLG